MNCAFIGKSMKVDMQFIEQVLHEEYFWMYRGISKNNG
jgi:hypothetical protein